jgi:CheY-like chemotaxis protein
MTVMVENREDLLAAKQRADARVSELEQALARARKEAESRAVELQELETRDYDKNATSEAESLLERKNEPEPAINAAPKKAEEPKSAASAQQKNTTSNAKPGKESTKTASKRKAKTKKDDLEQVMKKKSLIRAQLQSYYLSQKARAMGKEKAPEGNKMKQTACQVYLYLVDDNQLQLKVLQERFKNTRSLKTTVPFSSAEKCLAYVKKHKYPARSIIIVVADFNLDNPEDEDAMNGIDLLGELKKFDPEIEVIMLTGSKSEHVKSAAAKYGATNFIEKGPESFKATLDAIVWSVREKDGLRETAEAKASIKTIAIGLVVFFIILVGLGLTVFRDILRF